MTQEVNDNNVSPEEKRNLITAQILSKTAVSVSKISCGKNHAIILSKSSQIFVVGIGKFGELGLGPEVRHASSPVQLRLSNNNFSVLNVYAGPLHSMIVAINKLDQRSAIFTFGCGSYYRLGLGDDLNRYVPHEMENIPISYLGSNTSDNQNALIKLCFCGLWHSVIVFQDTDDVYAWGWNKFNQVGRGVGEIDEGKEIISVPRRITEFDCPRLLGENNCNDTIVSVSGGTRHTAFLTSSGRLLFMGQLGTSFTEGVDCRETISNSQDSHHIRVIYPAISSTQDMMDLLVLIVDNHCCNSTMKSDQSGVAGCNSVNEVLIVEKGGKKSSAHYSEEGSTHRWKVDKILSLRWSLIARAMML